MLRTRPWNRPRAHYLLTVRLSWRDLTRLDDFEPDFLSPEDLEAVLAALDRLAPGLAPENREAFAFNVLVNALGTVFERIRQSEPDLVPTYVAAAQVMLDDA